MHRLNDDQLREIGARTFTLGEFAWNSPNGLSARIERATAHGPHHSRTSGTEDKAKTSTGQRSTECNGGVGVLPELTGLRSAKDTHTTCSHYRTPLHISDWPAAGLADGETTAIKVDWPLPAPHLP